MTTFSVLKPKDRVEAIIAVIVLGALPWLFISGPSWLASDTGRALSNLGHLPLFGLVALLIHRRMRSNPSREFLVLTTIVAATGIASEGLQSIVGRNASLLDLGRNFVGAWFVYCWLHRGSAIVWAGRAATTSLVAWQCWTVAGFAYEAYQIQHQLPVIANFERAEEIQRWRGNVSRSSTHVTEGRAALQISLDTSRYSGAELTRLPGDWRGYEQLVFEVYNPGEDMLELHLRIDDRGPSYNYRDRFNWSLQARPGWTEFHIALEEIRRAPASRPMDLAAVERIVIFAVELPQPRTIYTDNWHLQ